MGIFVIRGYHPAKTSTTRTCPAGSFHYVLRHCWATWLGSVGARSSGRYLQESSLTRLGDEAPTRDWQDNEITLGLGQGHFILKESHCLVGAQPAGPTSRKARPLSGRGRLRP